MTSTHGAASAASAIDRTAALDAIQSLRHACAADFSADNKGAVMEARCNAFYDAYEAVRKLPTTAPPSTAPAVPGFLDFTPDLGAPTPEPSLRELIAFYYRRYPDIVSADKAKEWTRDYLAALASTTPQAEDAGLQEAAQAVMDALNADCVDGEPQYPDDPAYNLDDRGATKLTTGMVARLRAAMSRPQARPAADQVGEKPKIKVRRLDIAGPARNKWQYSVEGRVCGRAPSEHAAYRRAEEYLATRPAPSAAVSAVPEKALAEALRAIEFGLAMDDHYEVREFLSGWSKGDTTDWPEFAKGASQTEAKAAALAPAQSVPASREEIAEEWVLVPREPTQQMCHQGSLANEDANCEPQIWQAMIDYAPEPPDAILAARLNPEPVAGWQDISTAPKDGTWSIMAHTTGICPGRWSDRGWRPVFGGVIHPSHWLPLPEHPSKNPASSAESDGRTG